jgi:hypothetical protein
MPEKVQDVSSIVIPVIWTRTAGKRHAAGTICSVSAYKGHLNSLH